METIQDLKIAIVGGGIAGLVLAQGLLRHGIKPTVYERGESFRELGVGIGFTPNAEYAMKVLDPKIHAAFKNVTVQDGTDWFMWVDGSKRVQEDGKDRTIHRMYLGERGLEGCARADFLDELVKLTPKDCVHFSKCLVNIIDEEDGNMLRLQFADGSSTYADLVVGCDGIRSRVRDFVQKGRIATTTSKAHATYSHKYAYRGLIPMDKALAALGREKTDTRHMYLGPGGMALTFPVMEGKLLNVVAFTSDPNDWPYDDRYTAPATKSEASHAFKDFGPTVRSIIGLLPEELSKWAVFNMYDCPLHTFVNGRVCLTGDAAHAAAPYHGAGAGFAVEDAAVLCHLLVNASRYLQAEAGAAAARGTSGLCKVPVLHTVLEVYNSVRFDRAQWLVQTSRFVGTMYQWQDTQIGGDHAQIAEQIDWRCKRIWHYDIDDIIEETGRLFRERPVGLRSETQRVYRGNFGHT